MQPRPSADVVRPRVPSFRVVNISQLLSRCPFFKGRPAPASSRSSSDGSPRSRKAAAPARSARRSRGPLEARRTIITTSCPAIASVSLLPSRASPSMTRARLGSTLPRPCGGLWVESEGRREVPVSVDLCLQIGDHLLRSGHGIGAGDETARRRLLARNDDERSRELGRVAGLLAILGFPELQLLRSAL